MSRHARRPRLRLGRVVATSAAIAVVITAAVAGVSVGVLAGPSEQNVSLDAVGAAPEVAGGSAAPTAGSDGADSEGAGSDENGADTSGAADSGAADAKLAEESEVEYVGAADAPAMRIIMPVTTLERLRGGQGSGKNGAGLRDRTERALLPPTTFRVATFNILGHAHTTARGNKPRFADGQVRMGWAMSLLKNTNVSVAGLQELEPPQLAAFRRNSPGWAVWPGLAVGKSALANSVVWRSDVWTYVEGHTIPIPYFHGQLKPMPYVKLRHLGTGQEVWFANFHNPASTRGPAEKWRRAATAKEAALANQLTSAGTPLILTGDMNDKSAFFCPFTASTSMKASNGGSTGGSCQPPGNMAIDWIFGSASITFANHNRVKGGLVSRATDHPLIWADATVNPS